ncbi:MAG: AsmA-like C-terminal region-containing protein, partial [Pseudomonadota bacterium]
ATGSAEESAEAPESDAPAAEGWPDEPLDLPLPLPVNLDVDIEMASLKTPQLSVQNVRAAVTADETTTEAKLTDLGLYEGTLNTTLTANAGDVPAFAVNLDTKNIALLPILTEFAQFERLQGTGNANANLTTSGNSVKAIVENLDGEGAVLMRDGAILGINIAAFMREVMSLGLSDESGAAPKTDFAELGGTYAIEKGVLTNNDLTLQAPVLRLAGAGNVDLPQQSLDYTVKPQLAATLHGQDAQDDALKAGIPVVVSGPWAVPQIQLDIGGDLTSAITDPANVGAIVDQLKASPEMLQDLRQQFDLNAFGDVSEALQGAVGGALGGAGNAGEGAADAASDVKDKVQEGLKGLLGGN